MKTHIARMFCVSSLLLAITAGANISLTVGSVTLSGAGGPCWDDTLIEPPLSASGTFTLSGLSGTGVVSSVVSTIVNNVTPPTGQHKHYTYNVDLSSISAGTHCITVLIHFGTPLTCAYQVLVQSGAGVPVTSANKAPFGDITFTFDGGCLSPGQLTANFSMIADTPAKNGYVTIIDDYTNPGSGQTNESRIQVPAIVPDIPPDWAYAPPVLPSVLFQGHVDVSTNQVNMITNFGPYDFTYQFFDALSNGLPVGPVSTQTVQMVNGLFNLPLPGDPSTINGDGRWLQLGIRPSGLPAVQFTPLSPRQLIAPSPQALYAFTAGVVADIAPNQAVLNLNGFTGGVTIQAGNGITISGNDSVGGAGGIITVGTTGAIPSDRNIKTDFTQVDSGVILSKLAKLPMESWRYTNEVAGTRHLGPTAQDFRTAFGLGTGDTAIGIVDEGGVALTAIKALNEELQSQARQLQARDREIELLKEQLDDLEKIIHSKDINETRGQQ